MACQTTRLPLIDTAKALACIAIIWHHLAFYGPMSDLVHQWAPALIDALYQHGRLAVQVFLVVGGFLAAASLAPDGMPLASHINGQAAGGQILRRYLRLAMPYAVAVALTVMVSALVRTWADHPSIPVEPDLPQLLAHVLLLQDVLGYEALSAGAWYVAIDFQLFVMTLGLLAAARWLQTLCPLGARSLPSSAAAAKTDKPGAKALAGDGMLGWPAVLVFAATAASLLCINLYPQFDTLGPYFFGAYGLGALAYWSTRARRPSRWWLAMAVLSAVALWLDFRLRIAVAVAMTGLMVLASRHGAAVQQRISASHLRHLDALGRMSYSIFLVHFPVCLLVNMTVSHLWPKSIWINATGMVVAFGLSLAAGRLLFNWVEAPRTKYRAPLRFRAGAVVLACMALMWARGWG